MITSLSASFSRMPRAPLLALLALALPSVALGQAQPNLAATLVEAPSDAIAGAAVRLHVEVDVRGPALPSFSWSAYLSGSGALQGSLRIGTFGPVQPTAVGTLAIDQMITLPAVSPGAYFVAVTLDPSGAVTESNELDNARISAARVHVRSPSPNLIVEAVQLIDRSRRATESVALDVTVRNDGEVDASVDVAAFISDDEAVTRADPELGRAAVSVARGQRITQRIDGFLPADLAAGDYLAGVIIDPALSIDESNEIDNLGLSPDPLNVFSDTLELTTPDLPGGTVFIPYFTQLTARGGDGHYRFALVRGRLPDGLRLNGVSGQITGAPLQSGLIPVDIEVRSGARVDVASYQLQVAESGVELTIVTPALDPATLGLAYQGALLAAGGEPPYHWTVRSGAVPPGLDVGGDGWIRGIPTQEGHYAFVVEIADALGARLTTELSIDVGAPNVVVLTGELPPVPVGAPLAITLESTGGKPPYTWEALSAPPPGLTLTEDGVLTGVPSLVGRYVVRIRVTDASRAGRFDTALVHLAVEDAGTFEILTRSVPELGLREPLQLSLEVSGGERPFTWKLGNGESLPSGFELKQDELGDAQIVGTSLRALTQPFTLHVQDARGRHRQVALAIHVRDVERRSGDGGCRCVSSTGAPLALLELAGAALAAVLVLRRRTRR